MEMLIWCLYRGFTTMFLCLWYRDSAHSPKRNVNAKPATSSLSTMMNCQKDIQRQWCTKQVVVTNQVSNLKIENVWISINKKKHMGFDILYLIPLSLMTYHPIFILTSIRNTFLFFPSNNYKYICRFLYFLIHRWVLMSSTAIIFSVSFFLG